MPARVGNAVGPTPRSGIECEHRRHDVAARYLRGESQWAIAQALGIAQPTVSIDLKAVRAEWRASAIRDFDALKEEQLAKIDQIESEAWHAWDQSKRNRIITVSKTVNGFAGDTFAEASERQETTAGDPRYLERIQKCIEQRCALLGLADMVDKTNVTVVLEARTRDAAERIKRLRDATDRHHHQETPQAPCLLPPG